MKDPLDCTPVNLGLPDPPRRRSKLWWFLAGIFVGVWLGQIPAAVAQARSGSVKMVMSYLCVRDQGSAERRLKQTFQEQPRARFVTADGWLVRLWGSDAGTATVTLNIGADLFCYLSGGDGLEFLDPEPEGSDS